MEMNLFLISLEVFLNPARVLLEVILEFEVALRINPLPLVFCGIWEETRDGDGILCGMGTFFICVEFGWNSDFLEPPFHGLHCPCSGLCL